MLLTSDNKTCKLVKAICLAVACLTSQYAQALMVDLIPQVVAAYEPITFDPIVPVPDIKSFPGFPAIYQVDFSIFVYDLLPGEAGFANIGFNVLTENLTDIAGWQPDITDIDIPGPRPAIIIPYFFVNLDAGVPGDNLGILVSIAGGITRSSDPRYKVGQTTPALMGSLFVLWDGVTPAKLTTDGILFSSNSLTGQFGNTKSGVSTTIFFGVPEPCSLVLVTLFAGTCGLASRGRGKALLLS